MNYYIFNAMIRLGKEEFERVLGRGQVAVHTIDNDTCCVIGMRGRAPRHHRRLYFMA